MMCAAAVAVLAIACDGNQAVDPDAADPDAATPDAPTPDAPAPAMLVWDGTPYDFGLTEVGDVRTRNVTLRNDGGSSTGVVLSTDGAALRILQDNCVSLAPGATCSAMIELTVSAGGPVSRELRALPVAGGDAAIAPVVALGGFRLDVGVGGTGGSVTSTPAGINCGAVCTKLYAAGTTITLNANYVAPTTFQGWNGDCVGTAATCTVTLDAERLVGAVFDTPIPPTNLTIRSAGTGTGIIRSSSGVIACAGGPCVYPFAPGTQVLLSQHVIGDSAFVGWSGCTPSGNDCVVTVGTGPSTVTATYNAVAPATWVRTSSTCATPTDLALASDGLVAIGTVPVGSETWGALWIGRYAPDGTVGHAFTDDVSAGRDRPVKVVVEPGGDTILVAWIDGALGLRRYTPTGSLVYAVAPGGPAGRHGLALDAAGNVYVSGAIGGVPYIASYLPTGVERWRITPAGIEKVEGLAVRGAVLAAVGQDDNLGWVGTFDLAGNPGWQRTTPGQVQFPQYTLFDVAIDSDGDVVFGGLDAGTGGPVPYTFGAMSADGTAQQWITTLATRQTGELLVRSDDTVRVWIGYATVGQEPSRLVDYDEAGMQTAQANVINVLAPGGHVIDAAGNTFIAGRDWTADCTSIERRP